MSSPEILSARSLLRGAMEMVAQAHALLEAAEMKDAATEPQPEPADSPLKRRLSYMGANDEPEEG